MNVLLTVDRRSAVRGENRGKRARKSDAVYQDLKRQILTGEMTSESPITEQSLAQDYGCSQSTIREALMLLQECGLVVRRGYQGTFVTDPSPLEARLMLKIRIDIETTGIVEAVKYVTTEQLSELLELDDQFEACHAKRDVFGCAEIDRTLHLKLFRIARMPVLEPMLIRTFMILQRVMFSVTRSEESWADRNVTKHKTIVEALGAHDVDATVKALRCHILSSAVYLAPHIYGADISQLHDQVKALPVQAPGLQGL
ncbi:GntR family transcriptional regulator [Stappia sp. BW2]|uniref:GntR family transcriptional regulator n=1 Tax=Stappia sp. BW2 TaxID=2592622 RepID=UPI0011DEC9FD|nr:GntR family transcriptional regulator [Stappia sp. BW2]TYC67263.1 GntR family transcriptional regulator [Stappia sp. BW2]